jgi:NADP-dependent 3-hydroxy acid dehydrogenase YdfG
MVETNIQGVLNTTHALLPRMVERKRGYIVNIGSVAGTYPYAGGNVYGATKAFVHQFSLNLRSDLLGTPIRVTCIEPGMVETEFSEVRFKGNRERAKAVYRGLEALKSEDIAEAVRWCIALPPHVNINRLEVMPTAQAFSQYATHRIEPKKV